LDKILSEPIRCNGLENFLLLIDTPPFLIIITASSRERKIGSPLDIIQ